MGLRVKIQTMAGVSLLALLLPPMPLCAQGLQQDSLALVALYEATDGSNWINNANWLTEPVASWFGVSVSEGRVTSVLLVANQLNGEIPAALGDLDNLDLLVLRNNELSGKIPATLGNLVNLEILFLDNNELTGSIPVELGDLSSLKFLDLGDNGLAGPIPATLGNLVDLENLSLGFNQLNGEIPATLGNLVKLDVLFLGDNRLSGRIPAVLGDLVNLEILFLDDNDLMGSVPVELGKLVNLRFLFLNDNHLSGEIPMEWGNLVKLEDLDLRSNEFFGLPRLGGLESLLDLYVENNRFTFEDIVPNIDVARDTITYSPQAKVGMARTENLLVGASFTLSIPVGGADNRYQWFKDDVAITDTLATETLTISEATSADAGSYVLRITNRHAPELTLESEPITVLLSLLPLIINPISDQALAADPFSVDLNTVFIDPNGGELTYSADISDPMVARAEVSGTRLEVTPVSSDVARQATVTVTAENAAGGQTSDSFQVSIDQAPEFGPLILDKAVFNEDYRIQARITDNGGIASATTNFRRAGDVDFIPFPMRPSASDSMLYESTLPGFAVTRGVEFFIEATDSLGLFTREPPEGIFSVEVLISDPGIANPNPQPGFSDSGTNAYRLISIPLNLENQEPSAVLEDDLGAYSRSKWRFFEVLSDSPESLRFFEFGNTAGMAPGKAFWLLVRDANKTIDTGPGVTVETDEQFLINLQPGWTVFGNPFNFPIPVSHVLVPGQTPVLWHFEGVGWRPLGPDEEILPFEGYAVFNDVATDLVIYPDLSADLSSPAPRPGVVADSVSWSIRIVARSRQLRDVETVAVAAANASAVWDRMDRPEPPLSPGDYVSVYFSHPEWDKTTPRFSTDARPLPQDGVIWPVEVVTARRDPVHLTFEGLSGVPSEYEVWLIDEVLGLRQDLRQIDTYTVVSGGTHDPRSLSLVVGRSGFVEGTMAVGQELPERFELFPNFPNPFNPSTTIRYGLPSASVVEVAVYDVLGRQVAVLSRSQEQAAGYHAVLWDGRDDAGGQVASGVYFVRMRTERFVQMQKIVFVK